MNRGFMTDRRRARLGWWIDKIFTAIVVTVSVALSIALLAVLLIVVFAPSTLPPR